MLYDKNNRVGGYIMAISYKPLWIQLADKGLQKTDVIKKSKFNDKCNGKYGEKSNYLF